MAANEKVLASLIEVVTQTFVYGEVKVIPLYVVLY